MFQKVLAARSNGGQETLRIAIPRSRGTFSLYLQNSKNSDIKSGFSNVLCVNELIVKYALPWSVYLKKEVLSKFIHFKIPVRELTRLEITDLQRRQLPRRQLLFSHK